MAEISNIEYVTRPASNGQQMFNLTLNKIKLFPGAYRHHIQIRSNGTVVYQYGQATTFKIYNSTTGQYSVAFDTNQRQYEDLGLTDSSYTGNYVAGTPNLNLSTTLHLKDAMSTVEVE